MSEVNDVPPKGRNNAKSCKSLVLVVILIGILSRILEIGQRSGNGKSHDPFNINTTISVSKERMGDFSAKSEIAVQKIGTDDDILRSVDIKADVTNIGREIKDKPPNKIGRKKKRDNVELSISLDIDEDHEPYLNRWQRRFASSQERNKKGGYLFFRHMRKAGGTSLREYFRDVLLYHNVTRTANDWRAVKKKDPTNYQIYYIEHEFQAMDWQCSKVDPRWRESIRTIVLRHPIERHMSEYFFSAGGHALFSPIDKEKLYVNETYTDALKQNLAKYLPKWMEGIGSNRHQLDGIEGQFNMIFTRRYTDNFQLRALAGCTSGDCMKDVKITDDQMEMINTFHPSSYPYLKPVPRCTQYWRDPEKSSILEVCAKQGHIKEECSIGCDGPCFYPSAAWQKMGNEDVARALTALKAFDAVLIMEKFNEKDQSDFLSDVMGVPRDAEFAMGKRGTSSNSGVEKNGKRENQRFYRNLLMKLGLEDINSALRKDNMLEIELFHHAEKLNEKMIEQWRKESSGTA